VKWFVADTIRASVDFFVITGDLTTDQATIKERNFWVDRLAEMANHAPLMLVAGNHGAELEGDLSWILLFVAQAPRGLLIRKKIG
jgi:metallophosphoesterase superfamily enzyme